MAPIKDGNKNGGKSAPSDPFASISNFFSSKILFSVCSAVISMVDPIANVTFAKGPAINASSNLMIFVSSSLFFTSKLYISLNSASFVTIPVNWMKTGLF